MHTKPIINIVNVVASGSLHQKLDLYKIQKKFPHTEYKPEQFPGLVFRIKNPRTAILLFRTGKMVCTGAKSEKLARKAVKLVVTQLRENKIRIKKEPSIIIQNIVASVNLGGKINFEIAARIIPRSMYEPEQFPGIICRIIDPKLVILLFVSGKLVVAGAKIESDVYRAVNNFHSLLEEKGLMSYD